MRRSGFTIDSYFLVGLTSVLLIGGLFIWGRRPEQESALQLPRTLFTELNDLGAAHSRGEIAAPIRVGVFSDYECEGCALAHEQMLPIIARYVQNGTISYTVYDTPLPGHLSAGRGAALGRCISDPESYWAFHDLLFSRREQWQSVTDVSRALLLLAAEAGADTVALQNCMDEHGREYIASATRAWDLVRSAGVSFVPLWTVNGKAVNWLHLEREIEALRHQTREERR